MSVPWQAELAEHTPFTVQGPQAKIIDQGMGPESTCQLIFRNGYITATVLERRIWCQWSLLLVQTRKEKYSPFAVALFSRGDNRYRSEPVSKDVAMAMPIIRQETNRQNTGNNTQEQDNHNISPFATSTMPLLIKP